MYLFAVQYWPLQSWHGFHYFLSAFLFMILLRLELHYFSFGATVIFPQYYKLLIQQLVGTPNWACGVKTKTSSNQPNTNQDNIGEIWSCPDTVTHSAIQLQGLHKNWHFHISWFVGCSEPHWFFMSLSISLTHVSTLAQCFAAQSPKKILYVWHCKSLLCVQFWMVLYIILSYGMVLFTLWNNLTCKCLCGTDGVTSMLNCVH